MVVVDVSSGISGESNEGASRGIVDGFESKTLAKNPIDKGILSEGFRVSEDSKALNRGSNTETVIKGSGKELVESGRLKINDKRDISKCQMRSPSNRWDSWESRGVMDMVGRVLGGKFSMDDEAEDVNPSRNGSEANAVTDTNVLQVVVGEPTSLNKSDTSKNEVDVFADTSAWQGVIGEPTSSMNKNDVERTVVDKDSDELISDNLVEETGLKGVQDSLSNELAPEMSSLNGDHQVLLSNKLVADGTLETDDVINVEVDEFFEPKTRGEHQMTEKEGEHYVADLVWGKVKTHPWWPGQIFPPIAASDKASKNFRKQSYLVAYFGDQTFAWNKGSQLKPFRLYFSQMEKHSNSDGFCHAVSRALDEVTRRVEFGLSCPCLPEEVQDKIKIQVVSNAGICEDKNTVYGGDNLSSAASFSSGNLVQFVESVAECPQLKTDRLQFTIAKAQLLAFNRWKGHYKLPVFEEYVGLLEDDTQVRFFSYDSSSTKRKSTVQDSSSQKHKEFPTLKVKRISELMSSDTSTSPNVDEKPVKRAKRAGRRPVWSGKNSEGTNSITSFPKAKRRKNLFPTSPISDGEKIREAELEIGEESELVEIIPAEIPTPDVIRSKLILSAKVPMQGFKVMISEIDFLREFRNLICLEKKSSSENAQMYIRKHKAKQPSDSETANVFGFEGTKDSYWTDRIIQSYFEDQVFEPKKASDKAVQVEEADIKERDTVVVSLDSEKPSEECQRTALIMNFTNLDSIPSVSNLNEIFNRYGPLNESQTEILRKSKRVKVIFKRRADAETAFSSTGKYSIFGPSLVSYKLHYSPTPRASKRSKKDTSLEVGA